MANPNEAEDIPEAQPNAGPEDVPRALRIGPPFAMSQECELLTQSGGCTAVVKCDCGQLFSINLLSEGAKVCPGCDAEYTHVLVVTTVEDDEMAGDMFTQVLRANGFAVENDEDDDDDDEGEAGDQMTERGIEGEGEGEGDDRDEK